MMPMSLGLGLGLVHGGGGTFSPASLFAGGKTGGWFEARRKTALFTDVSKTTNPSDGDTVYWFDDLSGGGNHLPQATAARRPIFRENSGLSYLQGDGVDDEFTIATVTRFMTLGAYSYYAAYRGSGFAFGENNGVWRVQQFTSGGGLARFAHYNGGATDYIDIANNYLSDVVVSCRYPSPAGTQSAAVDNNAAVTVARTNVIVLGGTFGLMSDTGGRFVGRLYGACFFKQTLSDSEHNSMIRYMASLQGRSL